MRFDYIQKNILKLTNLSQETTAQDLHIWIPSDVFFKSRVFIPRHERRDIRNMPRSVREPLFILLVSVFMSLLLLLILLFTMLLSVLFNLHIVTIIDFVRITTAILPVYTATIILSIIMFILLVS